MRIALSVIVGILITLQLKAHPDENVKTGPQPARICNSHPDPRKTPARTDYTHYIRTIVNQSGVQNGSEVSATFSPQFQHVVFHRIAIVAIPQPSGKYQFVAPIRSGQRGPLADLFIPDYGCALVLKDGETVLQPVSPLSPGKINDHSITEIRQQGHIAYSEDSEKNDPSDLPGNTPDASAREGSSPAPSTAPAPLAARDWKVCWPAIWLTFFFSLFFSRLFVYLNRRGEDTLYAPGSGYPLGGWIALLGVSLIAIALTEFGRLLIADYYSETRYTEYSNAGGHAMQYIFLSQLAMHLSFIAGAGALLYWYFKKRDIFPRMFLWYAGVLLFGRILHLALSYLPAVSAMLVKYRPGLAIALLYTVAYSIPGVIFILRSEQVKSTFLEPFREVIR